MNSIVAAFKLFRYLSELTKVEKIDACFIEAQISFGAFMGRYDEEQGKVKMTSNPQTTLAIAKQVGAAEIVTHGRSIMTRTPAVSTVRKSFLGRGDLKGPIAKRAARLMCERLGWNPQNDDESDAGAVWYHGCLQVKPNACQIITPMLQANVVGIALDAAAAFPAKRARA